jgi:hypothetical protein
MKSQELTKNLDALSDYLEEIGEAFEEKVPKILSEAEDLA